MEAERADNIDELDDLIADTELQGLFAAYLCPAAETQIEGDLVINQIEDQITSYTSHYNKKLNKCLVDVHGISPLDGKVLESDQVYDALENTVISGRLFVKKGSGPDGEIESMVLIRDGRTIRGKQEAASFVPWFESLMVE